MPFPVPAGYTCPDSCTTVPAEGADEAPHGHEYRIHWHGSVQHAFEHDLTGGPPLALLRLNEIGLTR